MNIKGSGLEGKNIVTSGQILSAVIAMWLPCFFSGEALTRASDQVEGCVSNVRWGFYQLMSTLQACFFKESELRLSQ